MDKDLLVLPEETQVLNGSYLLNEESQPYNYNEIDFINIYKELAEFSVDKKIEKSITKKEWENYYKELIRIFGNNEKE